MADDKRPGAQYTIYGTDPNMTADVKLTRQEKLRREENAERRKLRCRFCNSEREPRSSPICPKCSGAKSHGGQS